MPTSITTAVEETWSPFSSPVRPAATTTTSAVLVYFSSGPDLEWQTVTVGVRLQQQQGQRLSHDGGTANDDDVPARQRDVKVVQDLYYRAGSGRCERGLADSQRPRLKGFAPSMSFSGAMCPTSSLLRTPGGRGVWRMMPLTDGSALRSFRTAARTCPLASWPRSTTRQSDAGAFRGSLDGPDIPVRRAVLGGHHDREGGP